MQVVLGSDDLKPIVQQIVVEMLDRFGSDPNRIAYSEPESAAMLGLKSHQLRDARLRGEITGAKLGKSYHYTRAELLGFLERRKA